MYITWQSAARYLWKVINSLGQTLNLKIGLLCHQCDNYYSVYAAESPCFQCLILHLGKNLRLSWILKLSLCWFFFWLGMCHQTFENPVILSRPACTISIISFLMCERYYHPSYILVLKPICWYCSLVSVIPIILSVVAYQVCGGVSWSEFPLR